MLRPIYQAANVEAAYAALDAFATGAWGAKHPAIAQQQLAYLSTESTRTAQTTGRLTIGRPAKAAGVNVETVRYYQRRRLLREPPRPLRGVPAYTGQDVARVAFINASQRLGFTLEQAGQLLQLDAGMQCRAAANLASVDVRARLQDITRIEAALSELLERCEHQAGKVACPLILALRAGADGQDHS